ncbi:hypothetical protein [Natrialba swarupiae]|uniref:Uncharacterized protein n=1 Tax=Natrialba swarupiae TaxID=2448032 RepID=A0A5D5ASL6_9EURY|nr:hypothetical protein [Natrialba swarupiae]TYT62842.1 hypothetical protein FYC77_05860 [Natrialba swarupiae]
MADSLVWKILIFSVMTATVTTVAMTPVAVADESTHDSSPMNETKSLAPVLHDLTDASDPEVYAHANDITYKNGSVLVVVELEGDRELPSGYDATVERSYSGGGKTLIEASVPVDQLRDLAAADDVEYVRPPQEAVPMADDDPSTESDGTDTSNDLETESIEVDPDAESDPARDEADTDSNDDALGSWTPAIATIALVLAYSIQRAGRRGVAVR